MDIEEYRELLKQRLSASRFHHSECVEKRAVELAKLYGADPHKAKIAGLVHDICKEMSADKQLKYLKSCDILLDNTPSSLHALTGSHYICRELGIIDDEIIGAVRRHTTGSPGMSLLEEILFIADFTSEDRRFPEAKETYLMAKENKNFAIARIAGFKIDRQIYRMDKFSVNSAQTYNYYINELKKVGLNNK